MTDLSILNAMQEMLYYVVVAVCMITLPMLVVGLVMSIIQAATQINEMTITFIPKFVVMFAMLFLLGPWFMSQLIWITHKFMTNLTVYIK